MRQFCNKKHVLSQDHKMVLLLVVPLQPGTYTALYLPLSP